MKSATFLCFVASLALAIAAPGDLYTDRYDSIDIPGVLNNNRLLEGYFKCLLEKGKCTPEGKELKSHIREALENECAKCTPTQRSGTRQVIGHLINNKPDYWRDLSAKYDPTNKFATRYENELRTVKAQ